MPAEDRDLARPHRRHSDLLRAANIPAAFHDVLQSERSAQAVVRKLVCGSLVESLVRAAPDDKQEFVRNAIITVLVRAKVISPMYMSADLQSLRDPLTQVIGSFVSSATSFFPLSVLSPRIDASLSYSVGDFSIVSSRYAQDFEELEEVGSGGFGRVFKVKSRLDGHFYAMKKVPLRSAEENTLAKTVKECRFHASLEDPHIVRYHNAWVELHSLQGFRSNRAHSQPSDPVTPVTCSDSLVRFTNGTTDGKSSSRAVTKPPHQCLFHPLSTTSTTSSSTDSSNESDGALQARPDSEGGSSGNSSDVSSFNEGKVLVVARRKRFSRTSHSSAKDKETANYPMLFIQMELCHASLETYLTKRSQQKLAVVDSRFCGKVLEDMISGLAFLHNRNVIHRDVKPSNIFLKRYATGRVQAMIGDFGLAVSEEEQQPEPDDFLLNPFPDHARRTRGVGTALYAAPEQLRSNTYDATADIYSAGVVIYELYSIFRTNMERVSALKDLRETAQCADAFATSWPALAALVEPMLDAQPDQRPSAKRVLLKLRQVEQLSETARLRKQVQALQKRNKELVDLLNLYKNKYEPPAPESGSVEDV